MQLTSQLTSSRRILTIDDNDAIHNDFRKILVGTRGAAAAPGLAAGKALLFGKEGAAQPPAPVHSAGFELDSAMQGQEGLEKLQRALDEGKPYSVAFVDMRMPPGWDGLQTIQRLWQVDPDLQVVICSAYSDYSWDEISAKLGLTDRLLILKKPFDPAEVTQIATALSEKWSLRRAAKLKMDELERMVTERTVELTRLALHDRLTGLGNRTMFTDRLEKSVARAAADRDYRYAVLFLDFDRFKAVNDSLGHEAGDQVLKGIAGRITAALELAGPILGDALACRLGGDEFTVLIEGSAGRFDAIAFAAQLLQLLAAPYRVADRDCSCTASIGITTSDVHYERGSDALRDADTAMYHAKANGKARYVLFDPRMHEAKCQRLELEQALRDAVEREEFTLHYQPIVSLATGLLQGYEALVRWRHPTRGLVMPGEFIPCCEEIGLIGTLGLWVLRKACGQLKLWRDAAPHLPDLTIAVNVSPLQVGDPGLIDSVAAVLRETGVPASALVLEITESAMMGDPDAAIGTFRSLRAMGIRLHLDDFGTGYSSLSSLHTFPLDGVKIDRSFMKNVTERRDYAAVVHAIINLARHLDMSVIVEGIEDLQHITLLQAMDCDCAQGYYFSRPVDAATAAALLVAPIRVDATRSLVAA